MILLTTPVKDATHAQIKFIQIEDGYNKVFLVYELGKFIDDAWICVYKKELNISGADFEAVGSYATRVSTIYLEIDRIGCQFILDKGYEEGTLV